MCQKTVCALNVQTVALGSGILEAGRNLRRNAGSLAERREHIFPGIRAQVLQYRGTLLGTRPEVLYGEQEAVVIVRMQKIGNPPGRIVPRRKGRKSMVQRRVVICGFFKPEAESHRGFGQHCYGAFPASKGIF